jgi:dUTP pyrophosphatase
LEKIIIKIKKEPGYEDLQIPEYQTEGSAGVDLYAAVTEEVMILPGEVKLIQTGIRVSIPKGFEAQIRPRSGLALKHGIGVLNSPGTIDSDYRGVVGVILFNFGKVPFIINRGARIAQMVFTKFSIVTFELVDTLDSSKRKSNGFGSTGV